MKLSLLATSDHSTSDCKKDSPRFFNSYNIVLLIFGITLLSFNKLSAQTIEKRWSMDIDRTMELMDGVQRTNFNNIPSEKRDQIKQDFSQRTFQFYQNQTFEVQWNDGRKSSSAQGKWSIAGQELIITIDNKQSVYSIRELNSTTLVIEKVDAKTGLFKVLAFNN